jgi:hypothetical protein
MTRIGVTVDTDFLVRVDSWCSLVAYRGLDDEAREELKKLSIEARKMYEGVLPRGR